MWSYSGLSLFCFFLTLAFYWLSKKLYQWKRNVLLMPLLLAPILLLIVVIGFHIPYQSYIADSHWFLWLLSPATVAFAIPVYDNRQLIRKHWLSLSTGVTVAVVVSVLSSVLLARLFHLPVIVQRSIAVRSITTPFAIEASKALGGQTDLTSIFVVLTGVLGMSLGQIILTSLSIRSHLGRGASLGGSSHGSGTAIAYQMGESEGVVSSVVMMFAGMLTVLLAPLIGHLLW